MNETEVDEEEDEEDEEEDEEDEEDIISPTQRSGTYVGEGPSVIARSRSTSSSGSPSIRIPARRDDGSVPNEESENVFDIRLIR